MEDREQLGISTAFSFPPTTLQVTPVNILPFFKQQRYRQAWHHHLASLDSCQNSLMAMMPDEA